MKGGVGKTTMVVGLAETLAAVGVDGQRMNVLVVDLDAQANASHSIAGDDLLEDLIDENRTVETFLKDNIVDRQRRPLSDIVRPNASALTAGSKLISLSLVAASPELRFVEREMIYRLTKAGYALEAIEGQVRDLVFREVEALKRQFDVIIFDCPPGISAFTEAVLKTSDLVIAPVIPDRLSTFGLIGFCNRVLAAPRKQAGALRLPWVLANRVQRNNTVHKRRLAEMRLEASANDAGFQMFDTEVTQSAALVAAVEYAAPAPTYATKYGDARDVLQSVARETLEVIDANK
jgi:cellulose biosynthesis protein BcsQ